MILTLSGHLQQLNKHYEHDPEVSQVAEATALSLQTQARVKDKNNAKTHKAFLYARLGKDAVNLDLARGQKKDDWDADDVTIKIIWNTVGGREKRRR